MILQLQENIFSIEDIHGKYLGKELKKSEFILSYYKQYLAKIKKLVGLEIKDNIYNKFVCVGNHLEAFLKWKYKKTDFPLEELSLQFLDDFDYYLKTKKKQEQITINKTIQRLRTPIKQAISEGYLDRDPFILHKSKTDSKSTKAIRNDNLFIFSPVVQRIEWEFPKLLIRVRFSAGLLKRLYSNVRSFLF